MIALEIHDAGLLAVGEGDAGAERGTSSPESPGFALLDGTTLRTGLEAARRARRMPRAVHSRFWQDLSLDPAGRPFPADWSLADLAHAHLEGVLRGHPAGEPALLSLSSAFSTHQLAILLGIFQAAGRPVAGLVDAAVAAVSGSGLEGPVLYLDPHLHRFTVTTVTSAPPAGTATPGTEIAGGATETIADAGLESFHLLWARRIAETLVRATRFDPLHGAASEQVLYDRLPGWLAEARQGAGFEARFEGSGGEYRAAVPREALLAAVEEPFRRILDRTAAMLRRLGGGSLLLSHRAAELPGLRERLDTLQPAGLSVLPRGAVPRAALAAAPGFELPGGGSLGRAFLRRLPRLEPQGVDGHGPA